MTQEFERIGMPPAATPLLSVSDLTVAFTTGRGSFDAVRGVSLEVRPGETVAIVGQSGSGKSTVTTAINRLLASNADVKSGSVVFKGRELLTLSEQEMNAVRGAEIGYVPQDPMSNLDPLVPVGRQIAEALSIHGSAKGRAARARAVELLDMVGIPDPRRRSAQYPHEFSGGMRQRVLLAMGLANSPSLLIADEPTSALDATVAENVLDELARLTSSMGTAVVLVTHDLSLAAARADRVVVLKDGEVVEEGESGVVLVNPRQEYTRRLIDAVPTLHSPSLVAHAAGTVDSNDPIDHVIETRDLRKEFTIRRGTIGRAEKFAAVDGVDIAVPRGTTVGIVGESGSGKSTTARMILRLESITSGVVLLDEQDVTRLTARELFRFRRRMQPVFQNPYASLDPIYTVRDAIREPLDEHRVGTPAERDERVEELLRQVALEPTIADRYPHQLSGGQRQRVAIARALALDPEIVVLDEAVSALDVLVQAQILDLLVDLQIRLGLTYLFISHDLAVVRVLSHYVHVMKGGRVVESGTPEEIFHRPRDPYTRRLISAVAGGERRTVDPPVPYT
jgi:peptide/nickel transport system ATP-binding protein